MNFKEILTVLSPLIVTFVFIFGGVALALALGVTGTALTVTAVALAAVGFAGFIAYLGWMTFAA